MHFHLLINKLSPDGFHVIYKGKKIDKPLSIPDALQVLKERYKFNLIGPLIMGLRRHGIENLPSHSPTSGYQ